MKKLRRKYKNYIERRSKKEILKRGRASRGGYGVIPKYKGTTIITINAPDIFNLKYENCEKSLRFISAIKSKAKKKKVILNIRLANVREIGEGAIAILLSVLNEINDVVIHGDTPKYIVPRKILEKSGFLDHVKSNIKTTRSQNTIIKTGDVSTSQNEIVPKIRQAVKTVWGREGRCPELYGGIGEMFRNSCDHAFEYEDNITWHVSLSHLERENNVKFSFVDNGIGIIKRFKRKKGFARVMKFFENEADTLNNAYLEGIKSRTGLDWRGKGLPTIYEMYQDNIITNLVVITNNVYLDFDREIIKTLRYSFSGTYYFWRIDRTCKPSYFVDNL